MSGKSKLTIEEILKSDRKKINADEENILDDKFSLYNKRKTIVYFTCIICKKQVWTSFEKAKKSFNNCCQGCNTKQTMIKKYGVENFSQTLNQRKKLSEKMKERNCNGDIKNIMIKKYGVSCSFNLQNIREKNISSLKSEEHKEKIKLLYKTNKEISNNKSKKMKKWYIDKKNKDKILVRNKKISDSLKSNSKEDKENIYNKRKQTMINKYGTFIVSELEKTKQTNLKKYNSETYFGSEQHKKYMQKYRLEHPEKFHQHGKHKYKLNNLYFDSKCELDFYVFCLNNNILCERNTKKYFNFTFNNKQYKYYPDFILEKQYIEIKGEQFLKKDGSWQNPYNHEQDCIYEAKHQCALLHNVKIIYSKDLEDYKNQLISQVELAKPQSSLKFGNE